MERSLQVLGRRLLIPDFRFFFLRRFFNRHVVKLFRIKDIATFKTLNIFRVFVAGNNSYPRMFAGGDHLFMKGLDLETLAADCS